MAGCERTVRSFRGPEGGEVLGAADLHASCRPATMVRSEAPRGPCTNLGAQRTRGLHDGLPGEQGGTRGARG
eukprot:364959-Chlamydomonas_euryale.AAC.12